MVVLADLISMATLPFRRNQVRPFSYSMYLKFVDVRRQGMKKRAGNSKSTSNRSRPSFDSAASSGIFRQQFERDCFLIVVLEKKNNKTIQRWNPISALTGAT